MAKKQPMRMGGSLAIHWLKVSRGTGRVNRRNPINRLNRNQRNPNPPNNAEPGIDLSEVSTNPNHNTHPANDLSEVSTNPNSNTLPANDLSEVSNNPIPTNDLSEVSTNPNNNPIPTNDLSEVSNNPNNNPIPTDDLNEVYRTATEPSIHLTQRRMESSLKRCSAVSNDKKDIAVNQIENASNDKLNPTPVSAARHMESSLERCSALSNKDTAFNQTENTSNDKLNPTPVSAVHRKMGSDKDTGFSQLEKTVRAKSVVVFSCTHRRMESSLKRCSAVSNDKKDIAVNQTENASNDKLNPTPVSAARRKMGSDKDTGFSQLGKTVRAKSLVGLSRTHVFGCVTPYSRALASRVGKGVMRLPLSEKAKNLVKGGMSVGLAVRTVGFQNAFTSWRDGASIYVYLRAKNGGLAVTKA